MGDGKSPRPGVRWFALSLNPPLTGTLTSHQNIILVKTPFSHSSNGDNTRGSANLIEQWWDNCSVCRYSCFDHYKVLFTFIGSFIFTPGEDCIELTSYVLT